MLSSLVGVLVENPIPSSFTYCLDNIKKLVTIVRGRKAPPYEVLKGGVCIVRPSISADPPKSIFPAPAWLRADRDKSAEKSFLIGAAIGTGMIAKAAERGGADFLLALNAGRVRVMGAP